MTLFPLLFEGLILMVLNHPAKLRKVTSNNEHIWRRHIKTHRHITFYGRINSPIFLRNLNPYKHTQEYKHKQSWKHALANNTYLLLPWRSHLCRTPDPPDARRLGAASKARRGADTPPAGTTSLVGLPGASDSLPFPQTSSGFCSGLCGFSLVFLCVSVIQYLFFYIQLEYISHSW